MLNIVEALKEFSNSILGHQITVFTQHCNLTYESFKTDRVMRWHLTIAKYSPELIYIKKEKTEIDDALFRLAAKDISLSNIEYIS